MKINRILFTWLMSAITIVLLAACGGSSDEPPVPTAEPTSAVVELTAVHDASAVPGAVTNLQEVQKAVVQIEAQGTFIDPEVGVQFNAGSSGTGFIIDPSGIAVTNNHVVTGAGLVRVYLDGEDQPRNARLLGNSECADLAVIDIDGEGFPYLQWNGSDVPVLTNVFAAGFPLGDPEYTATRGVVSKASTVGETMWASVDKILEHDATINPGNSGGPLVDENGRVVGVNYAGNSQTNQYFAISGTLAQPIIEQLRASQDVNSIGVNGIAINDGEGLSGIWVRSVESGSPADAAGIKAGDIITALEGLILATDGTMSDYCDILRSHAPEDTLNLSVLRFETQEMLEGQLNGRTLEQSFSFAQSLDTETVASSDSQPATGYSGYLQISDDSGSLTVEVPVEWSDVDGSEWTADGEFIGWSVSAAPDLDAFNSTWTIPGVFFGASISLADYTPAELLSFFDYSGECTLTQQNATYEDPLYTGSYDLWESCGDAGTTYVVVAAKPASGDYVILVAIQAVSEADYAVLDQILNTFIVNE